MSISKEYCSYDKYHLVYDTQSDKFSIFYLKKPIVTELGVEGIYKDNLKIMSITDFSKVETEHSGTWTQDNAVLILKYYLKNSDEVPSLILNLYVGNENVCIEAKEQENNTVKISGNVCFDREGFNNTFPVSLKQNKKALNCSIGNGAAAIDYALYNKKSDWAVVVGEENQTKISADKEKFMYSFEITAYEKDRWEDVRISLEENVLAEKYNIIFSPLNKNSTFSSPPVGWMTWYAVKFDACEEKVLKNAAWQAKNLKDYGANTVWVDWEWYHNDMSGDRNDGVNSLQPDLKMYPNGMKYVADRIKEMGLIPSLWIGFTNEPSKNKYIEKYPDMVLVDETTWCGRYYYDFSNPNYLNKYLPEALKNVHKWGYKAVKYDTIPISLGRHERNHEKMYDATLTTREAYRNMLKKTREILGENMYMLSCSGSTNSTILWASDMFDAARIGEDIFSWEEHLTNIKRIAEFYPLHNIQLYVDADNVVLRDEFNDFEQAKARATIISLLGLPMTFGDEFSDLSEDRIRLLKKSLPILDIHPSDLCPAEINDKDLLINLKIDKDYENYQVTGAFNLTDENYVRTIRICEDMNLEKGEYLVYDFYRDEFLGKTNENIKLEFLPYECRVLSLRPYKNIPQIISTSRHITQGAAEICDMKCSHEQLTLTSKLIKNDEYRVTIYVPTGYKLKEYNGFETCEKNGNLLQLMLMPKETREYSFCVRFEQG